MKCCWLFLARPFDCFSLMGTGERLILLVQVSTRLTPFSLFSSVIGSYQRYSLIDGHLISLCFLSIYHS